ncbi:MAG: DUF3768 domain-containing protein [Gammaproteobacteria bacterium]|nr:DUF3768 domain-containing protein [Gammaproteobacteria bacterium]
MSTVTNLQTFKLERIAQLNDAFRRSFIGGRVVLTQGVYALDQKVQDEIFQKVMTFGDFNEDNDPYGEHDFGCVEHLGRKYFFKIDYYAEDMKHRSEDPANARVTNRVLTIMRAEEY